jgi:DNA-binding response OmpR family regulator
LTVSANILLIDAERTTMARAMPLLTREGYQVAHAVPGQAALDTLHATQPDLVIVSVEPNSSGAQACGWHFCRQIAASLSAPLLLLLPDRDESTRVKALELGADDCMTRPVRLLELVARVRALLRRSRCRAACPIPQRYVDGDLTIDLTGARVSLNGSAVPLAPAELRLLACLVDHAGRPVAVDYLCAAVWGADRPTPAGAVRRAVARLRQKLETDPRHPRRLVTRRGEGYALVRAERPAG